ncbi:MAG: flagellar export protein FliJ [Deltaproteobacteria bacterium]|nr:MAG: flagellar export protein FliJ [Deltaproteobacteria bacterium]
MTFSFRLQPLLNWKANLEELSRLRLTEKTRALKAEEKAIRELTDQRAFYARQEGDKTKKGVRVWEFLLYREFAEESFKTLERREDRRRLREEEMKKERESLIGLMKEKKILERLKEKKLRGFIDRMERLEQQGNDEIATQRYRPPLCSLREGGE